MEDSILGHVIDYYYISERIKAGGVAVVYKAIDRRDNRLVALKLLQTSWAEHEEVVKRFQREAEIMETLQHPYIVPFRDHGIYLGRPYIVMDYMPGGSLSERLKQTAQFNLGRTAEMLLQIGGALDYAHSLGVIHRDIKPGNILIKRDGHAALTDFGIARVLEGTMLTNTGHMPGTPHYMSPEQASGIEVLSPSTDIYSLGVIAYLLCTGKLPFGGTDAIVIINQHLHAAPPKPRMINPELPPRLEPVLLRVLEKNPQNRYQTAGEFAKAFAEAVQGHEQLIVHLKKKRDNEAPAIQKLPSHQSTPPGIPKPPTLTRSFTESKSNSKTVILSIVAVILVIIGAVFLIAVFSGDGDGQGGLSLGMSASTTPTDIIETPTNEAVDIITTSTPSPQPTDTPTSTDIPIPSPTETSQSVIADQPSPTPQSTATSQPTNTITLTPPPTETAQPTARFNSLQMVLETLQNDTGSPARFNCQVFVEAYEFLNEQISNNQVDYMMAQELVLPGSPARNIYDEFCRDAADQTNVFIQTGSYLIDMRNLIRSLLDNQ